MQHLVIIGNGIAGVTTARYVRKQSDMKITIISAESDHFYARTALMYIYMGHMTYEDAKPYEDWFWAKNRIELVRDVVAPGVLADRDPQGDIDVRKPERLATGGVKRARPSSNPCASSGPWWRPSGSSQEPAPRSTYTS